jgi:hypothetical protein
MLLESFEADLFFMAITSRLSTDALGLVEIIEAVNFSGRDYLRLDNPG